MAQDEQALVAEDFDRRLRARLRASISENLIAEHQASPGGPHRDALSRVLRYFRSAPIAGKYAIYAERHFAHYRIVSFSGRRGFPPPPSTIVSSSIRRPRRTRSFFSGSLR